MYTEYIFHTTCACLLLGLGLPEQAMGWLPLRFRIVNLLNFHMYMHDVHVHCVLIMQLAYLKLITTELL